MKKDKKNGFGAFGKLGICDSICKVLCKQGLHQPTPIQRRSIPTVLLGRNCAIISRTGSGKTLTYTIPMLMKLNDNTHSTIFGVKALVVLPTRELSIQIYKVIDSLSERADFFRRKNVSVGDSATCERLRCCLIVGGTSINEQFNSLLRNPDVIVCTPGRLLQLMVEIKKNILSSVSYCVFDETDRILEDSSLSVQLKSLLLYFGRTDMCKDADSEVSLNVYTLDKIQFVLCSATLASNICSLFRHILSDIVLCQLEKEYMISPSLKLQMIYTRASNRSAVLLAILRKLIFIQKESVMIFVPSRQHCDYLSYLISFFGIGVKAVYGSMDQDAKVINLNEFRSGKVSVIIMTDIGARGLDVPFLDNVINYDFPVSAKLFIHRVGRTARNGRHGVAISIVGSEELPYLINVCEDLNIQLSVQEKAETYSVVIPGSHASDDPIKCFIGSLEGNLRNEVEFIDSLHSNGVYWTHGSAEASKAEISNQLLKSLLNSCKMLRKTRKSCSRQYILKGKSLSNDFSDSFLRCVHPDFFESNVEESKGSSLQKDLPSQSLQSLEALLEKPLEGTSTNPQMHHDTQKGSPKRYMCIYSADELLNHLKNFRSPQFPMQLGRRKSIDKSAEENNSSEKSSFEFFNESNRIDNNMHHSFGDSSLNAASSHDNRQTTSNLFNDLAILENLNCKKVTKKAHASGPFSSRSSPLMQKRKILNNMKTLDYTTLDSINSFIIAQSTDCGGSSESLVKDTRSCCDTDVTGLDAFLSNQEDVKLFLESSNREPKRKRRRSVDEIKIFTLTNFKNPSLNNNCVSGSTLDLALDDLHKADNPTVSTQYRQKRRWDPVAKRYTMVCVNDVGRVFRDTAKCSKKGRGEILKQGFYRKWVLKSRISLPAVGQNEISQIPSKKKIVDNEDEDADITAANLGKLELEANPKFKELKNSLQNTKSLTYKQKRVLKKLGSIKKPKQSNRDQLRSPLQMNKIVKKSRKGKTNTSDGLKAFKKAKRAKQRKNNKLIVRRGAANRSIMVVHSRFRKSRSGP